MIPAQHTSAPDETLLRYAGWRAVLACFLMALFLFGFALYGQGIYLVELQRLNGWPPELISGASTLSFLISNVLATFTSEFVDRLGAKRLVLLGIAALAGSMAMLASATTVWQLYAAFILMSMGWIGMGTVVIATVVSLWFVRRRGLAISLAYTGASFGGVVATPLLVLLVERFGFAAAMLIAAAVTVAVLVPVALAWIGPRSQAGAAETSASSQPQPPPATADISRAKLIRSLAFWTISLPFALALVAQIGFIVHQIALLEPKVGRSSAGLAVSVMTFMSIAGRFGLGMVVDRFDPRLAAAFSIVSQAVALLAIRQADTVPVILAASAVFGFSVGNLITLPPLIIHREFSPASFVVVMGLSTAISGTIGALGPGLIGVIRGWSSDYDAALLICIVLELVAAAIVARRGISNCAADAGRAG
ncbi:MAG TPA: MFS transporter [Bradyrhizobium sp.]|nr:MFS transporter [Bradyrhizobium sp.]